MSRRPTKLYFLATALILCLLAVVGYLMMPSVLAGRASQELQQREHSKAARTLQFAANFPTNGKLCLLNAALNRRLGDLKLAEENLAQAEQRSADQSQLTHERNLLALAQKNYPSDISAWRQLVRDAQSDLPEVCQAFVMFRISRFEIQDANELLKIWEAEYPNDPLLFRTRALLHEMMEEWEEAIATLTRAHELSPDHWETSFALGKALARQLHFERALPLLESCLRERPEQVECRAELVSALAQTGDLDGAQSVLDEAESGQSGHDKLRTARAIVAMESNDFRSARKLLTELLSSQPQNRELRYLLARCLRYLGQHEQAQEQFELVKTATEAVMRIPKLTAQLTDEPENRELRFEIARLSLRYYSEEAGLRWFGELFQLDPSHEAAHSVLAEYFRDRGDIDQADYHARFLEQTAAGR